jgi:hypothetical protein
MDQHIAEGVRVESPAKPRESLTKEKIAQRE